MTPVGGRGGSPSAPRSADVAQLAGVSRKTVSRVLNNEPYVSDDVRRRVIEAAEKLGYRLNNAARALASGRTRSIGVVALGTAGYGTASLLVAIEKAVRDSGYALRVVNTLDGEPDDIARAVDSLLEQGVDGIIVSEPVLEGEVSVRVDVPVLFLGAPPAFGGPRAMTAGTGADLLARAATDHLLDLGHQTVHHLAGPLRWYAARDRVEGWRAALAARGRHQPPLVEGDWSADSGYQAGRELAADPEVTAVFVSGDDMAIGLIHALAEAGRRVPHDVSVIGFDGNPVFAYVTPPLTTVRQPFDAAAREGVRLLVHAIEKPDTEVPPASDPPVELVVRASTAPPPSSPAGRRTLSPRSHI
ncbi:DNA-binding LacI/PurR family transcriptional regulator [Streptomyces africanus]|uniref:DNA-binding LacI/PurR family transcriptional regulator n=1 Tax=Streptomyces africanus TaxID=231024 RepID=A0ABU0R1M4_9ACTN|nr:LacI family DNA-binding transcriptional regulator [Streptomyces africanus]MDQ0753556.1 DNA-binding LacI/PurR family transcriptional regulator [Streptomyces africanus]